MRKQNDEKIILEGYNPRFTIYTHDGRYYLNQYNPMQPIWSYSTLKGVYEAAYYQGYLPTKEG